MALRDVTLLVALSAVLPSTPIQGQGSGMLAAASKHSLQSERVLRIKRLWFRVCVLCRYGLQHMYTHNQRSTKTTAAPVTAAPVTAAPTAAQVTAAPVATYGTTCTAADTCTFTGTTCKDDGASATKCLCDATKNFKTKSSNDGCECNTGYAGTTTCLASLGTACTTTADCDTTETGAVCDLLAGTKMCSLESTATCTGKEAKCVSNAACTGGACACSAGFVENTAKLCVASLGTACTTTADCDTTEVGAVCDLLAGTKICALKSTATCTGKETQCVSNAACTGGACACSSGFVENTAKLCVAKIETTCAYDTNCVANAYCSSGLKCACKPQYTATVDKTSCKAIALGGACTATGGECASLTNAYCDTVPASRVCACATVFPISSSACTAKSCASGAAACTDVDPNTECSSNACKCKANYGIFSRGTKAVCQPGVGATCSANGGECGNLPGGFCNTVPSTAVCACRAIYDVSTTSCNPKPCDRGSTTCGTADANSECGPGYCVCKLGMSIGPAGKCVSANLIPDSGAEGLIVSMVTLIGCLLISKLE